MHDNIRLYHVDHLGSTSLVTDIDGEITQHVAYIPYGEVFVEERNGSWNTPYLFNAKELDEETGLYYYGARYLDPKDTRWLSVDPMFEKYVGASPYNYCHDNPVVVVDPNGMDEYEVNSNGYVTKITECKNHVIYAVGTNGKRTGASMSVQDKNILEELSGKHDKDKRLDYSGDYATTTSKEVGKKEIGKLFTFLASNTDVEWNLGKYKGGNYGLGTTHEKDGVIPFHSLNDKTFNIDNLIYNVHSHPASDGTKGASNCSVIVNGRVPDFTQIIRLTYSFSKKESNTSKYKSKYNPEEFPKFFVYHKYSSHLYQYTPFVDSIDLGVIDKDNSLFKRIDASKGSLFKPKK